MECYNRTVISSILIKASGPDCNLRCNYCFYRQKAGLFEGKSHRMSDRVLDEMIRQAMEIGVTTFSWQGGEPALMGLDFYKKAVETEIKYGHPGMTVANAFQSNVTLLDRKWAEFLGEYKFLVGASIDGPARLHDHYRKDMKGQGTHKQVMNAVRLLREHNVEVNALVLLNDVNVKEPDAIYEFLKEHEFYFMQFVPCVEAGGGKGEPAPFCITPEAYGDFLVRVFDLWVADFPGVSVRDFDDLLLHALGRPPGTCMVSDHCADYAVVEHNGDVFCCDFFVQAKWRLGNILETHLGELVESEKFAEFKRRKAELGKKCTSCEFLGQCYGGCQKHRIVLGGEPTDPSYFCKAYKKLFKHAKPIIPALAERIAQQGPMA
jgi:uncharacterized protein